MSVNLPVLNGKQNYLLSLCYTMLLSCFFCLQNLERIVKCVDSTINKLFSENVLTAGECNMLLSGVNSWIIVTSEPKNVYVTDN